MRLTFLTSIAMLAFAANSVLCRLALKETSIDAASFTSVRILSGAIVLWLLLTYQNRSIDRAILSKGSWLSALALFIYAAGFSLSLIHI